jgi:hypothetical protein
MEGHVVERCNGEEDPRVAWHSMLVTSQELSAPVTLPTDNVRNKYENVLLLIHLLLGLLNCPVQFCMSVREGWAVCNRFYLHHLLFSGLDAAHCCGRRARDSSEGKCGLSRVRLGMEEDFTQVCVVT